MTTIKFGTDGWRAIVGHDFTEDNVAQVIQAFVDLYPTLPEAGQPVIVGFDRRKMSKEAANLTAAILTGSNIKTYLSSEPCPTPFVSWTTAKMKAAAGVMITASHNPPEWNGVKFKESFGGSASPEFTDPIEKRISENQKGQIIPAKAGIQNVQKISPKGDYTEALRKFVNLDEIKKCRFKILVDPMYGTGAGYFPLLLDGNITEIHNRQDFLFGGIQPEPIPPHVNEAIEKMKGGKFDICLITDGDADRIGAIDENGRYVTSHEIFALILKHLVEVKDWRGGVIKSITTTRLIDRLCKKYRLKLTTTKVGFKHISPLLNHPNVLMGGEESGGMAIPRHVAERDGLLASLLLLEIMAKNGKKIGELTAELQSNHGPCFYKRIDLHLDEATIARARKKLNETRPTELSGRKIVETNRIDGYHFLRDDESWLLIRPSGTEPLLRTYAEAGTPEDVEKLLEQAKEIIGV